MLQKFPHPVQLLILKELRAVEEEDDDDDFIRLNNVEDDPNCWCIFYRRWQLPCRYIIKQHQLFGAILTDDYWQRWHSVWDESGFEIYEGMTKDYINEAVYANIGAPIRRKLELRDVLDGLLNSYYENEAYVSNWPEEQRDEAISNWISHLDLLTGQIFFADALLTLPVIIYVQKVHGMLIGIR